MTNEGGLNRWEVMQMTNIQRKTWIELINERIEEQKNAQEKAKANKGNGPHHLG